MPAGMRPRRSGNGPVMEPSSERTTSASRPDGPESPAVTTERSGDVARITVSGELTDGARRPLVREVTDLLLAQQPLQRIDLLLGEVGFVNSAGIAVLVQLHKLVAPRAIELVLVGATPGVVRPLQLTGLWHRFTVADGPGGTTSEGTRPGTTPGRTPGGDGHG